MPTETPLPLPDACAQLGIAERSGRRLVDSGKVPIAGWRKNPRGKPSAMVRPSDLSAACAGKHRPAWVTFRERCEEASVCPDATLRLVMAGCEADLDQLAACLRMILKPLRPIGGREEIDAPWRGGSPFLFYLHGQPLPVAGEWTFERTMAEAVRARASRNRWRSAGDFRASWAKAKRAAFKWRVRASHPLLWVRDGKQGRTVQLVMQPDYAHDLEDNISFRGVMNPPAWSLVSLDSLTPAKQRLVLREAADGIYPRLGNGLAPARSKRQREEISWALNEAARTKAPSPFIVRELLYPLDAPRRIFDLLDVPKRSGTGFLLRWWWWANRKPRKVSAATVERIFSAV